mmetsp:Transcript_4592/g.3095  ORF Transcript_4592/g.3095 Transcript_4592/m.3095 type:complete len:135 (+) Transcript_4592:123-527(+)
MRGKIQRIELIKHNPQNFHMEFFSPSNMFEIVGGAPSLFFAAVGAGFALSYFRASIAFNRPSFYSDMMRSTGRIAFGGSLGLGFGYLKFGDRQRLHNAYVAERLRRRYPESMTLSATDLWKLKGVQAPHEYYKW